MTDNGGPYSVDQEDGTSGMIQLGVAPFVRCVVCAVFRAIAT